MDRKFLWMPNRLFVDNCEGDAEADGSASAAPSQPQEDTGNVEWFAVDPDFKPVEDVPALDELQQLRRLAEAPLGPGRQRSAALPALQEVPVPGQVGWKARTPVGNGHDLEDLLIFFCSLQ